jgi:hypothetical protein
LVFPVLAREDAALLDLDGALLGSVPLRLAGGLVPLWLVGMVIVGAAVERARVLPRGTGILLAVATVLLAALAALAGPFVPVAGQVASVIFSGAQAWLGWSLLTSVRPDAPRVPDRPLASKPSAGDRGLLGLQAVNSPPPSGAYGLRSFSRRVLRFAVGTAQR